MAGLGISTFSESNSVDRMRVIGRREAFLACPTPRSRCLPTAIRNRQRWKYFRPTYWIMRQLELRNYPSITSPASLPTLSISISTLSPGFSHFGGSNATATPEGEPVVIMSPGISVMKVEI